MIINGIGLMLVGLGIIGAICIFIRMLTDKKPYASKTDYVLLIATTVLLLVGPWIASIRFA